MKTHNIVLSLVIMLLLFFGACREVTITTKVNPDGSFTRIVTVTGDSSDVIKTDLPFPVDESWLRASSRDTCDSTKYIMTYSKSFKNSMVLNNEIISDTGPYSILHRDISITKKFRFFFSYLTFKEIYKSVNPFTSLDYHKYLTEDDIQWYSGLKAVVNAKDSIRKKDAEEKVMEFLSTSAASEVESIMRDGIKRLDDPSLNSVDISVYHDSLNKYVEGSNFTDGSGIINKYRIWSGNESFLLLNQLEPPIFEGFMKKIKGIEQIIALEGYAEEVEMPGLITATNSAILKGNQVRWEFQPLSAAVSDYEMFVESRVINYWVFILSGCVLLALVGILVISALRK